MFRFSIRDVLWLTALVAVATGWWIDHRNSSYRLREAANNEAKLANCAKLLRETIECLEAEGYIWGTSPDRVYLKRDPRSPPRKSD
jgi:hypothetical protein